MADVLAEAFAPLGAELSRVDLPDAQHINARGEISAAPLGRALHFSKRPQAARRVLLVIHYDTVYAAEDPFQSVTDQADGTLRGPGVVDAKGGIAVMLAALQAFEASGHAENVGWEVILNPDEEIGSPGSAALLERVAKQCDLALLFEPSLPDGSLVGPRKGSGNFTIVARGRAAHAGRDFAAGRSAVLALCEVALQLNETARSLGEGVTMNCGTFCGGSAVNVVPDLAIGQWNVRVSEREQMAAVQEQLRAIAAMPRDGVSLELHGQFSSPPKPLDDRSRRLLDAIIETGQMLDMRLQWRPSGGTCDGNRLAAAGIPVIDSLGPVGGHLHSPQEFVVPASIAERASLVAGLLIRLATGDADWP